MPLTASMWDAAERRVAKIRRINPEWDGVITIAGSAALCVSRGNHELFVVSDKKDRRGFHWENALGDEIG